MDYVVEGNRNIILPFHLRQGRVKAVKAMTTPPHITILYPRVWETLRRKLNPHGQVYLDYMTKEFELRGGKLYMNREFVEYLGSELVRVIRHRNRVEIWPLIAL